MNPIFKFPTTTVLKSISGQNFQVYSHIVDLRSVGGCREEDGRGGGTNDRILNSSPRLVEGVSEGGRAALPVGALVEEEAEAAALLVCALVEEAAAGGVNRE